jgi:hypothetical protein
LRELWKQHPDLRQLTEDRFIVHTTPSNLVSAPGPGVRQIVPAPRDSTYKTWLEHVADDHQVCGGRFVPLISKAGGFTSSLEIPFLRRDNPGNPIASGGDIDNRIKVLLDGLRMPSTVAELGDLPIETDENPFFCLLEDDNLITSVSVTTDRLLTRRESSERLRCAFGDSCGCGQPIGDICWQSPCLMRRCLGDLAPRMDSRIFPSPRPPNHDSFHVELNIGDSGQRLLRQSPWQRVTEIIVVSTHQGPQLLPHMKIKRCTETPVRLQSIQARRLSWREICNRQTRFGPDTIIRVVLQ